MDDYIGKWFVDKDRFVTIERVTEDIKAIAENPSEYSFSLEEVFEFTTELFDHDLDYLFFNYCLEGLISI